MIDMKILSAILLFLVTTLVAQSQTTLYTQDFNSQNNKGAVGGSGGNVTYDTTGINWKIDVSSASLTASSDYAKVVAQKFEFRDTDGEAKWSSPKINIANKTNLTISVILSEAGSHESDDYIKLTYKIDNGPEVTVRNEKDDFTSETITNEAIASTGDSLFIYVYAKNNAGSEYLRFDDVEIKGEDAITGTKTADIDSATTNIAGDTISSLITTPAGAKNVFRFKITDSGTEDTLGINVSKLTIKPALYNTADWTNTIHGITLNNGSNVAIQSTFITDTSIVVNLDSGNLVVPHNSSVDVTMAAYFNTSNLVDGDSLQFKIKAINHSFSTGVNSSPFLDTINAGYDILSSVFTVEVSGTEMRIGQDASNTDMNAIMSPAPTVQITDANGNIDKNSSALVSATSTGSLVGSPISVNSVNGIATFNSIVHSAFANGLKLNFTSTGITAISSSSFNINSPGGLNLTSSNAVYTITFDSTVNNVNQGQFNGSGITDSQSNGKLNSSTFSISGMSQGSVSFGGSSTSGDYARGQNSGGVTSGGMYAFEVNTGDYAMGFQPTGSDFTPGSVTIRLNNQSGDTIKNLVFSFDLYEFNNDGRSTEIEVSHNDAPTGSFTTLTNATITTQTAKTTPTKWVKNTTAQSISGIEWLNGAFYYIKFTFSDNSGSGSRDEIALDNLNFLGYKNSTSATLNHKLSGTYNCLILDGNETEFKATGKVTILNDLNLTKGKIDMNGDSLILGNSSSDCSITGGNDQSFVSNGIVKSYVNNSSGNYPFHFGNNSNSYSPASINFTSSTLASSAYLIAQVAAIKHPNQPNYVQNYLKRHWVIEPVGISNPNYNIELQYLTDDIEGNEASFLPVKYSGGVWSAPSNVANNRTDTIGTAIVDNANNKFTWNGLTSFSTFGGLGDGAPLPIELSYFKAKLTGNTIEFNWETFSEINSHYFEIEELINPDLFESLGDISAAGNSNLPINYTFKDESFSTKTTRYFRLKMVDFDGSFKYSKLVKVEGFNKPNGYDILVKNNSIEIVAFNAELATLTFTNIKGEQLKFNHVETNNKVSVNLPAGAYYLQVEIGNETVIGKRIFMR